MNKVYLIFFLSFLTFFSAFSQQTNVSKDNNFGLWTDNDSWVNGVAPAVENIEDDFLIRGYLRREGNLDFEDNLRMTIRDTLFVTGDFVLQNNAVIRIAPGGVFIVTGDFIANDNALIASAGRLVVKGDISFARNNRMFNQGAAYIYDDAPKAGIGSALEGRTVYNEQVLEERDPELYAFVEGEEPLPIDLLYFRATGAQTHVRFDWATASEENFDYFLVERSSDLLQFQQIDTIKGKGGSHIKTNYAYHDFYPLAGLNYYRLKAVDIDGTFKYSPIALFHKIIEETTAIFPNPSKGRFLNIKNFLEKDRSAKVSVKNISGAEVLETVLQPGLSTVQFQYQLSSGIYFVELKSKNRTFREKLIVD